MKNKESGAFDGLMLIAASSTIEFGFSRSIALQNRMAGEDFESKQVRTLGNGGVWLCYFFIITHRPQTDHAKELYWMTKQSVSPC